MVLNVNSKMNIEAIMNNQQMISGAGEEVTFVKKGEKIILDNKDEIIIKDAGFITKAGIVTTKGILKAIKATDVEVIFLDSSIISSVHKKGKKYIIKINSDLNINLIRYFILHELAHILSGDVTEKTTEGNPKNFEFEFEEVDLIALKTYIEKEFDRELIKKSPFFAVKREEKRFNSNLGNIDK